MATIDIPDDMNVFMYDQETVNRLYHTASRSFWFEQFNRFELMKDSSGKIDEDNPPEGGVLLYTEDNYLHAIIIYNWYVSRVAPSCVLFDVASSEYAIWVDVKGEWPDNYKEITGGKN